MTTVPSSWPNGIERYRAAIFVFGAFLTAVLLKLADLLDSGHPLGGVDWLSLLVGVLALVAVYFPADAWAKFTAGVVGAVVQAFVVALTDGHVTAAEVATVGVSLLAALGIGALPNAPHVTVADQTGSV